MAKKNQIPSPEEMKNLVDQSEKLGSISALLRLTSLRKKAEVGKEE